MTLTPLQFRLPEYNDKEPKKAYEALKAAILEIFDRLNERDSLRITEATIDSSAIGASSPTTGNFTALTSTSLVNTIVSSNTSAVVGQFINPNTGASSQGYIIVGQGTKGSTFGADYTSDYGFWGLLGQSATIFVKGNSAGVRISAPVGAFHVKNAADIGLSISGATGVAGAVSLNAINDAGGANIPMELRATNFGFTGPTGSVLIAASGQLTAPAIIPSGSTVPTNGLYLPAANNLGWATNSAVKMRLDASGNLGIGVTPAGTGKFQVAQATDVNFAVSGAVGGVAGSVSLNAVNNAYNANIPMEIRATRFRFTGTTRSIEVDTAGNVGFGTTTFGTSAAGVISIANGTAPTTGPADTVQLYSSDNAAGHTIPSFFCEGTDVLQTGVADSASSRRVRMRINGTVVQLLAV